MADGTRLMGIDYGDRRIGLAVSDPSGMIATPAGHLVRRAGKRAPVAALVRRAAYIASSVACFIALEVIELP